MNIQSYQTEEKVSQEDKHQQFKIMNEKIEKMNLNLEIALDEAEDDEEENDHPSPIQLPKGDQIDVKKMSQSLIKSLKKSKRIPSNETPNKSIKIQQEIKSFAIHILELEKGSNKMNEAKYDNDKNQNKEQNPQDDNAIQINIEENIVEEKGKCQQGGKEKRKNVIKKLKTHKYSLGEKQIVARNNKQQGIYRQKSLENQQELQKKQGQQRDLERGIKKKQNIQDIENQQQNELEQKNRKFQNLWGFIKEDDNLAIKILKISIFIIFIPLIILGFLFNRIFIPIFQSIYNFFRIVVNGQEDTPCLNNVFCRIIKQICEFFGRIWTFIRGIFSCVAECFS